MVLMLERRRNCQLPVEYQEDQSHQVGKRDPVLRSQVDKVGNWVGRIASLQFNTSSVSNPAQSFMYGENLHSRPQPAVHSGPGLPVLILVGRVLSSGSGAFAIVVGYG